MIPINNHSYHRLMRGRLGVYEKQPYNPEANSIEGIDQQAMRFRVNGGNR